jgi:hypothetical protein
MSYSVSSTQTFATTPARAWETLVEAPLETLFDHRSGPIPPVKSSVGPWGSVGAARTITLKDGSTNTETMIGSSNPDDYRYELSAFTGPMKALVRRVEGTFEFDAEGDQTVATWSWVIHPTNPVTGLALPVLGFFWKQWAAKMWPKFGARL